MIAFSSSQRPRPASWEGRLGRPSSARHLEAMRSASASSWSRAAAAATLPFLRLGRTSSATAASTFAPKLLSPRYHPRFNSLRQGFDSPRLYGVPPQSASAAPPAYYSSPPHWLSGGRYGGQGSAPGFDGTEATLRLDAVGTGARLQQRHDVDEQFLVGQKLGALVDLFQSRARPDALLENPRCLQFDNGRKRGQFVVGGSGIPRHDEKTSNFRHIPSMCRSRRHIKKLCR